jgi:ADP-ribose pyrophosphatase YjhB (NUDIX family)
MSHPDIVVHLEHDGKVLLVNEKGIGPQIPVIGRVTTKETLRLPTVEEIKRMGLKWSEKRKSKINLEDQTVTVLKGYPNIAWPENWAWKDDVIADNSVHPVAREAIYRSIHRLVSKVIIRNSENKVLLAKVSRGHFVGHWTLPGGYMEHDEHPSFGCVRETIEELGLEVTLNESTPIITQQIFTDEGISFVSFTYQADWNGDLKNLKLQEDEISDVKWFSLDDAKVNAVSFFDKEAIYSIKD